ncbi:MAG: low molecular weight protein-tyrosine-phosphatase [Actinomycetota bacterium]
MTGVPARSVCFVCTGNICRSPMADVITRALLTQAGRAADVIVSSAGTGNWHEGDGADPRTVTALADAGYDGSDHVARQFDPEQFADLDLIVALDRSHLIALRRLDTSGDHHDRIVLLDGLTADDAADVPDPYWGDAHDFQRCLTQIENACRKLLDHPALNAPHSA